MKEETGLRSFKTRGKSIDFKSFYSEQLKDSSKNFLANAQELNKMMKKKTFFGW